MQSWVPPTGEERNPKQPLFVSDVEFNIAKKLSVAFYLSFLTRLQKNALYFRGFTRDFPFSLVSYSKGVCQRGFTGNFSVFAHMLSDIRFVRSQISARAALVRALVRRIIQLN